MSEVLKVIFNSLGTILTIIGNILTIIKVSLEIKTKKEDFHHHKHRKSSVR